MLTLNDAKAAKGKQTRRKSTKSSNLKSTAAIFRTALDACFGDNEQFWEEWESASINVNTSSYAMDTSTWVIKQKKQIPGKSVNSLSYLEDSP